MVLVGTSGTHLLFALILPLLPSDRLSRSTVRPRGDIIGEEQGLGEKLGSRKSSKRRVKALVGRQGREQGEKEENKEEIEQAALREEQE